MLTLVMNNINKRRIIDMIFMNLQKRKYSDNLNKKAQVIIWY